MKTITRGEMLREIRRHLSLTQEDFAAVFDCTQRKISHWENGKGKFGERDFKALEALLLEPARFLQVIGVRDDVNPRSPLALFPLDILESAKVRDFVRVSKREVELNYADRVLQCLLDAERGMGCYVRCFNSSFFRFGYDVSLHINEPIVSNPVSSDLSTDYYAKVHEDIRVHGQRMYSFLEKVRIGVDPDSPDPMAQIIFRGDTIFENRIQLNEAAADALGRVIDPTILVNQSTIYHQLFTSTGFFRGSRSYSYRFILLLFALISRLREDSELVLERLEHWKNETREVIEGVYQVSLDSTLRNTETLQHELDVLLQNGHKIPSSLRKELEDAERELDSLREKEAIWASIALVGEPSDEQV